MVCGKRLEWRGFWLAEIDLRACSATIIVILSEWFQGRTLLLPEGECSTSPDFSKQYSRVTNCQSQTQDDHHDGIENDEGEFVIGQITVVTPISSSKR